MSLSRIALRIAAVEALKGKTLVGDNVLDTPNGALDIQADGSLRTEETQPFIAIYTDVGRAENITGRALTENGSCDIIFEIGVSNAMMDLDKASGETKIVGVNIPVTDGSLEFFLDIVQRQIVNALNSPSDEWAKIYRGLHYRILKIEFAGARNAEDGQRLAGHQLRITVDLADDPLLGEDLNDGSPFRRFLDAIEATEDPTYTEQATIMRSLITGDEAPWENLMRRHGMTADELKALGHGPLALTDDGELPDFDEADIIVGDLGTVTVTDE